mmetsp:Transcript_16424/g.37584  ORF Transcript_16424/g.37584 Transcript_16424/m.37584 type:complete len:271 (+) Transcript_16424:899-1711(+)
MVEIVVSAVVATAIIILVVLPLRLEGVVTVQVGFRPLRPVRVLPAVAVVAPVTVSRVVVTVLARELGWRAVVNFRCGGFDLALLAFYCDIACLSWDGCEQTHCVLLAREGYEAEPSAPPRLSIMHDDRVDDLAELLEERCELSHRHISRKPPHEELPIVVLGGRRPDRPDDVVVIIRPPLLRPPHVVLAVPLRLGRGERSHVRECRSRQRLLRQRVAESHRRHAPNEAVRAARRSGAERRGLRDGHAGGLLHDRDRRSQSGGLLLEGRHR